jgi:hypothetical protein
LRIAMITVEINDAGERFAAVSMMSINELAAARAITTARTSLDSGIAVQHCRPATE